MIPAWAFGYVLGIITFAGALIVSEVRSRIPRRMSFNARAYRDICPDCTIVRRIDENTTVIAFDTEAS